MISPAQAQWAQDHLALVVAGVWVLRIAATSLIRRVRRASGRRCPLVGWVTDLVDAAVALVRAQMARSFMDSCDLPSHDRDEVNRRSAEGIAGVGQSAGKKMTKSSAPRQLARRRGRRAGRDRDER